MRIFVFMFIVGAVACAHADEPPGPPEAPLAACVAAANGAREVVRACIGVAAWPCIDAGEGATQARIMCWSNEQSWWMARAREVAIQLEARDPERAPSLHAASAAFESFVARECAYRADAFQGGSGAQPAMAQCAAELWAERYIMLDETNAEY